METIIYILAAIGFVVVLSAVLNWVNNLIDTTTYNHWGDE